MRFLKVLFLLMWAAVFVTLPAQAATYYVSPTGNDTTGDGSQGSPWASIQTAFNRAADDDTIMAEPGTYAGCLELSGLRNGPPAEQRSIHLRATAFNPADPDSRLDTVIDGAGQCVLNNSVVNIGGFDSSIEGFTITGGTFGAIWNLGSVTITNNVIEGNNSSSGGAVYSYPNNCFYGAVDIAITNNLIRDNVASEDGTPLGGRGGALMVGLYPEEFFPGDPLTTPDGCLGGGGTIQIEGNTIDNNDADFDGGAIYAFTNSINSPTTDTSAHVIITQNVITNNVAGLAPGAYTAGYGGGIFASTVGLGEETVQITNNQVLGNTATGNFGIGYGGGIWAGSYSYRFADHDVLVQDNTVTQNTASTGGGMEVSLRSFDMVSDQNAKVVASENTISGNTATNLDELGGGGGLSAGMFIQRSSAAGIEFTIEDNVIRQNAADVDGAGAELRVAAWASNFFDANDHGVIKATAVLDFKNNLVVQNNVSSSYEDGVGGGLLTFTQSMGGESALQEDSSVAQINLDQNTIADNTVLNTAGPFAGGIEVESHTNYDRPNYNGEGLSVISLNGTIVDGNNGFGLGGPAPGEGGLFAPDNNADPAPPIPDSGNFTVSVAYSDSYDNEVNYEGWIGDRTGQSGNIDDDPLLSAQVYEPATCSPTIDTADPAFDFSLEAKPDGGRANMGHTGGTPDSTSSLADASGDGTVDGIDVLRIAVAFGSSFGDPRWDGNADLDSNNLVDGNDLSYVAGDFGQICP